MHTIDFNLCRRAVLGVKATYKRHIQTTAGKCVGSYILPVVNHLLINKSIVDDLRNEHAIKLLAISRELYRLSQDNQIEKVGYLPLQNHAFHINPLWVSNLKPSKGSVPPHVEV